MQLKKLIPVLAIMLAPIVVFSQSELQGTWMMTLETSDGPAVIKFDVLENGTYEVDLGNDGTINVKGVWEVDGNTFKVKDTEGEAGCPDDKGGVFSYKLEGEKVTFTAIDDPCGRGGPEGKMEFTRKN